jgi:HAD superfamily hydrolase (TIGR01509 family)
MRAVFFDFDGTILDTETPEFRFWEQIYADFGLELLRSEWVKCIGLGPGEVPTPYEDIEARLGRPIDSEKIRARRQTLYYDVLKTLSPRPGVLDWIAEAQSHELSLAVVSSSPRSWVVGHLERLELLGLFTQIFSRDDVARAKPDPELYVKAAMGHGLWPNECIAIEDSPNGVLSAVTAGCHTIAVGNEMTRSLDLSKASLVVNALNEITLASVLKK